MSYYFVRFLFFFCFFTGFSACEQDENLKQFTSEKKKKKRIKRSEKKKQMNKFWSNQGKRWEVNIELNWALEPFFFSLFNFGQSLVV